SASAPAPRASIAAAGRPPISRSEMQRTSLTHPDRHPRRAERLTRATVQPTPKEAKRGKGTHDELSASAFESSRIDYKRLRFVLHWVPFPRFASFGACGGFGVRQSLRSPGMTVLF